MKNSKINLPEKLFNDMGNFSTNVLSKADVESHLNKLIIEAEEAKENPEDLSEFSDCLLALFAAVHKAGYSYADFMNTTEDKFKIVLKRKWVLLNDGTYQHK